MYSGVERRSAPRLLVLPMHVPRQRGVGGATHGPGWTARRSEWRRRNLPSNPHDAGEKADLPDYVYMYCTSLTIDVLHAEIVDNECERYVSGLVLPQTRRALHWCKSILGHVLDEAIVGDPVPNRIMGPYEQDVNAGVVIGGDTGW